MKYTEDKKFECMVKMAMLDCGAKDAAFFDSIETDGVVISRRLKNKVNRTIRKAHNEHIRMPVKKVGFKVLLIALITMSLFFMISMAIPQIREAIFNTIVEWYEDYFVITYEQKNTDDNAAPPNTIEVVRKPTYVPEGAVESKIETKSYCIIYYYIEDTLICKYYQTIMSNKSLYFDNQAENTSKIDINGTIGYLIECESIPNLIVSWTDKKYVYVLENMELPIEELLKMAESIE